MKKIKIIIAIFALTITFSWAQVTLPHYEAFDYSVGDSLPMHGWTGVNGGDQILVTAGSLSYTGLMASVGNKASFDGAGRDFQKVITTQTSGIVYMSAIFQVSSLGSLNATGGYYTGFGNGTTTFASTIWLKLNGTGFNIGLNSKTTLANTVWDVTVRNINTPIFVVVSYEFVANPNNDLAKIWINPSASSFGGSTPPTPTITINNQNGDLAQIDRFFLRQDAANATPFIDIDEMRVANTWAEVTPAYVGINELSDIKKFQVSPNPSNGNFYILYFPKSSYDVKVFNTLGINVYSQTNISSKFPIKLSNLEKGIYFVQIKDNESSIIATKKIVIQ